LSIELTAKGVAGHGSVPLRTNPIVHLANAVGRVGSWKPEIRLNETTGTYFRRLAAISAPAHAERYRDVLVPNSRQQAEADEYFLDNEPAHASMLRTSVSPNILGGGYRVNIIPSEAKVVEANVTKHYYAPTLPTMLTGATDMAYLRAKGMQCLGIGPAIDVEDGPKGFGAHSDQERLLESELFRFVRFHWDLVVDLARAR
jgi:acetylornithine deacetylase/succinyl-diaminopimelate desuccinylase-like protein